MYDVTKLKNGASQNLYSYNGAGAISAIRHTGEYRQTEGGDLSYYLSYDSNGNTVEKTAVDNAVRTITKGTDADGNAFVSNDGVTVTSEKDDFGRISSVTTANAN
ncbi:MAG: hypothetical protein IJ598_07830, partial [Ruminococcus sp.]|nr:hypothetical protein [Ruminococcus sp.]